MREDKQNNNWLLIFEVGICGKGSDREFVDAMNYLDTHKWN
jgi:hypothetical protein